MPVPVKTPIVASLTAQERFAQNINPNDPEQAMFSYQESMHQHAMEQLEHLGATSEERLYVICELNDFSSSSLRDEYRSFRLHRVGNDDHKTGWLVKWELRSFSQCRLSSSQSTKHCCIGYGAEAAEFQHLVLFRRLHILAMRVSHLLSQH
jgi:hypothetical protein